jgi:galactonate dehydratase
MKIADLKTFIVGNPPPYHGGINWVFLKLTTDDGISGYGEVFKVPFHPPTAVKLVENMGEHFVIGADPFKIERLWKLLYGSGYDQHPDITKMGIISAFEMACWDIIGKAVNQPIYNLLGGMYNERLRSYTYLTPLPGDTGGRHVFTDPQKAAESAVYCMKQGFTAVKLDPIATIHSPYSPRELPLDVLDNAEDVIRSVREAVGNKCDILIGTHGELNTYSAIRLAKRLEKYDPLWFEEPVPPDNIEEMAIVARSTSIPVSAGERLATKADFVHLIEKHAAVIIQMALGRAGGIMESKAIAKLAEMHYAQIAPHLYCGPIEMAANIQIDVCSPNFLIQESIDMCGGFHAEILKKPLKWENGYIIPPTEPGLGVELNEEVAAKYPYNEVKPGEWKW